MVAQAFNPSTQEVEPLEGRGMWVSVRSMPAWATWRVLCQLGAQGNSVSKKEKETKTKPKAKCVLLAGLFLDNVLFKKYFIIVISCI